MKNDDDLISIQDLLRIYDVSKNHKSLRKLLEQLKTNWILCDSEYASDVATFEELKVKRQKLAKEVADTEKQYRTLKDKLSDKYNYDCYKEMASFCTDNYEWDDGDDDDEDDY